MQILVIGAGVSGLSCALRLLEAGHSVRIWTRDMPQHTTSAVAAALWFPYLAEPVERVLPWSEVTFRELMFLSASSSTGIVMRDGYEVFREPQGAEPWWASAVPSYRRATASELPAGQVDGWALCVPVIDMSIYLAWLEQQVLSMGATITQRSIQDFNETRGHCDVVINCTGLGAREVSHDAEVYGVRGQIQVVHAPEVTTFLIDDSTPSYIIPRVNDVVLGGTAGEHEYHLTVNDETAQSIRQHCTALMPELANAPTIANRVGIRPCRSTVRLESEIVDGVRVIHNYGHGGAGVTLSWGCAAEVAALVMA